MAPSPFDLKSSAGEGVGTLLVTALELVWGLEPFLFVSAVSGSVNVYSSSASWDCL